MIGTTVSADVGALILSRAESLRMSQSSYVAAIIEQWEAAGCPPVTEADRAMLHLRELERKTLPPKPVSAKRSA